MDINFQNIFEYKAEINAGARENNEFFYVKDNLTSSAMGESE